MTRISFRRHRYSRASWRLGSCRSAAKIFHSFEKYLVSKSPLIRTSQLIQFLVSVVLARLGTRRNGACLPTQSPWQLPRSRAHGKYFLKTSPKYFWVLWRILSQNLGWADHRSQPQVRVQSVQYNIQHYRYTTSTADTQPQTSDFYRVLRMYV